MSAATLLAAIAAFGITYDWQPLDDPQGGQERVVTAAQMDADSDMVPLRHLVAKPVNPSDGPVKHSVYQQPYPPQPYSQPNDLYQGFQDVNAQQRRTIGSEIVKGTEKLIDGTGKVIRNTGDAIEGTAQNMRDGFRSVVTPTQPQTQPIAAAQPGGYQPYSYNQPTSIAPVRGVQPSYPSQGTTATTPTSSPINTNPTQYNLPVSQQPKTSQPNWNSTATSGQSPNQYRTQPQPQSGNNYAGQRYSNQGSDAYVDLVNPRGTPASNGMVNLQKTQSQGFNNPNSNLINSTPPYQNTSNQTPKQYDYPQNTPRQPPTPNPNMTAGSPGDSFGNWPTTPASNSGNNYTPPAQQQTNYQGGSDPSSWAPIQPALPSHAQGNPADKLGEQLGGLANLIATAQPQPKTSTWFPLVLVAAIGSIAWNFYLGMNYIDARSKYRAVLRRSGKAYAEAFDDV